MNIIKIKGGLNMSMEILRKEIKDNLEQVKEATGLTEEQLKMVLTPSERNYIK